MYTGSHEPLGCLDHPGCADGTRSTVLVAGQFAGPGTAVAGALVLAGVSGRLLGGDRALTRSNGTVTAPHGPPSDTPSTPVRRQEHGVPRDQPVRGD
jgi:hypothetical protein